MSRSKGLTPVIATVLLITISLAATGTAYQFIQNAQEAQRKSYYEDFNQRQVTQGTDMDIESIYESSGNTYIILRNTGRLRLLMDEDDEKSIEILVDGQLRQSGGEPDWSYASGDPNPGGSTFISPSESIVLQTDGGYYPSSGSQNEFKLVGRYGTTTYYTCYNDGSGSC